MATTLTAAPTFPKIAAKPLSITTALNIVLPFATYTLLSRVIPETTALAISALFPLVAVGAHWHITHRINLLGALSLASVALSLLILFATNNPHLMLVKSAAFTFATGVAFLLTLIVGRRPLVFKAAQMLSSRGDPAKAALFDTRWAEPRVRVSTRLQTALWGIGLTGQAVALVVLVYSLPIETFMAVSPLIQYGTFGLLFSLTHLIRIVLRPCTK